MVENLILLGEIGFYSCSVVFIYGLVISMSKGGGFSEYLRKFRSVNEME